MKKRMLGVLLIAILILGVSGCGSGEEQKLQIQQVQRKEKRR